jgi:hypothetical protein
LRWILGFAAALFAAQPLRAQPRPAAPIAADALRMDLDLAYSALKEGTPGLYRFTTKARVDRAFAEARVRIKGPITSL